MRKALLALLLATLALPGRSPRTPVHPFVRLGAVQVRPTADGLEVIGEGMRVRISAAPWRFAIDDAAGHRLVAGVAVDALTFLLAAPRGRRPTTVRLRRLLRPWHPLADGVSVRVATDDPLGQSARIEVRAIAPGVVNLSARLDDDRAVASATVAMRSGPDEHFFGLGEQFGGVDARGRRVGMLVQDGITTDRPRGGYAPVPFFVSSRGYGFYLAGTRPGLFALDVAASPVWQATTDSPVLSWYLFDGPRPADAIARYADLTGHPPMPPPWALGVWKTLLGGERRVLADARLLRTAQIPVSVIWSYDAVDEQVALGWPYHNFQRIVPGPYPALPAFTSALHRLGYKVLGYVSPEFTPTRPSFTYPATHGYFMRHTGGHIYLLDLTNPAALRWWQGNLRSILNDLGFDGWLQDLGDRLPPGAHSADGRGALDLANLYPLLYAQASEAVARTTKPDALFVMRSGVAGIQGYQRAVWAGDQRSTWDRRTGFPAVISAGLSWGIAQAPFWGSDIGGYLEGQPPLSLAAQEELYLRWVEVGAFSPIMRDTLGDKGPQAIAMDSNARTLDAFRSYARLHQQLFPYLYAAARTAHLSGLPIMRHLFLAYPTDRRVYGLDDEYLLGPDLLVAPVTVRGARQRTVYLPAGRWIDYWTGRVEVGGRSITDAAPVERIPLFVRAGALLPLAAYPGDTLAPTDDPTVHRIGDALLLRLYSGGSGDQTTLADGTALAYATGTTGFTLRIHGHTLRDYQVVAYTSRTPTAVLLDGRTLPHVAVNAPSTTVGWWLDRRQAVLHIALHAGEGQVEVR